MERLFTNLKSKIALFMAVATVVTGLPQVPVYADDATEEVVKETFIENIEESTTEVAETVSTVEGEQLDTLGDSIDTGELLEDATIEEVVEEEEAECSVELYPNGFVCADNIPEVPEEAIAEKLVLIEVGDSEKEIDSMMYPKDMHRGSWRHYFAQSMEFGKKYKVNVIFVNARVEQIGDIVGTSEVVTIPEYPEDKIFATPSDFEYSVVDDANSKVTWFEKKYDEEHEYLFIAGTRFFIVYGYDVSKIPVDDGYKCSYAFNTVDYLGDEGSISMSIRPSGIDTEYWCSKYTKPVYIKDNTISNLTLTQSKYITFETTESEACYEVELCAVNPDTGAYETPDKNNYIISVSEAGKITEYAHSWNLSDGKYVLRLYSYDDETDTRIKLLKISDVFEYKVPTKKLVTPDIVNCLYYAHYINGFSNKWYVIWNDRNKTPVDYLLIEHSDDPNVVTSEIVSDVKDPDGNSYSFVEAVSDSGKLKSVEIIAIPKIGTNEYEASDAVTVEVGDVDIESNADRVLLRVGESKEISLKDNKHPEYNMLIDNIHDESIVTVEKSDDSCSAVLRAVGPGYTKVLARVGRVLQFIDVVVPYPMNVAFAPGADIKLEPGMSTNLKAKVSPSYAPAYTKVTYSLKDSADAAYVELNENTGELKVKADAVIDEAKDIIVVATASFDENYSGYKDVMYSYEHEEGPVDGIKVSDIKPVSATSEVAVKVVKKYEPSEYSGRYYVVVEQGASKELIKDKAGNPLPDEWNWVNLKALSEVKESRVVDDVEIVAINPNTGEKIIKEVDVVFAALSKLEIHGPATITANKPSFYSVVLHEAGLASAYNEWDSDAVAKSLPLNLELVPEDTNNVSVALTSNGYNITAKKKGNYKINASYKYGDTVLATGSITVKAIDESKGVADITVEPKKMVEGSLAPVGKDGTGDYEVNVGDAITLVDSTPKSSSGYSYKIKYSSSDANTIKVGKTVDNATPLEVLKSGYVTITAAADDDVKSTSECRIHIIDPSEDAITIDNTDFTINPYKDGDRGLIKVIDSTPTARTLTNAAIKEGAQSGVTASINDGRIEVQSTKTGKVTLALTFKRGDETTFTKEFPISVKINAKKPSATIKQFSKFVTFDKVYPMYSIGSADANIKAVKVTYGDNNTEAEVRAMTSDIIEVSGIPANVSKLNFSIEFDGYTAEANYIKNGVSVARDVEKFSLKNSSGVVYAGLDAASGDCYALLANQIISKKTKLPVDLTGTVITTDNADYEASVSGTDFVVKVKESAMESSKADTINLTFTNSAWGDTISLKYKVSKSSIDKAKLQLGSSSATLYDIEGISNQITTPVSLKGGAMTTALLRSIKIEEVVAKGKEPVIGKYLVYDLDTEKGNLTVTKIARASSSYTCKLQLTYLPEGAKKPISTTFTVKVSNVDNTGKTASSVKVKAKGSIDSIDRFNSYITLTPTFKNVPADAIVKNIELVGENAELFGIGTVGSSTLLGLKPNVPVRTGKYPVKVKYTLLIGEDEITVESANVNIAITQKSFKAYLSGGSVMNSNERIASSYINITLKNAAKVPTDVERVELVDDYGAFKIDSLVDVRYGSIKLDYYSGRLAKNKTYNLKFKVYPKGACLNGKPVTVTYKVTIK